MTDLLPNSHSYAADLLGPAIKQLAEAGIESPRFEAQLMLAITLGVSRTTVVAELYQPLDERTYDKFIEIVNARARRTPLAYLRGFQEFYCLPFRVGPDVLVPRPETEMLVEDAIQHCTNRREAIQSYANRCEAVRRNKAFVVADVGTGSGCIAISILNHCPEARVAAFDISPKALITAYGNAVLNDVADRLRLVRSDLLTAAPSEVFDHIVSNPPYIPTGEIDALQPEVRDYEPRSALDGGADGLDCYRNIVVEAWRALRPGGRVTVEVGITQAAAVEAMFRKVGLTNLQIQHDLAGIERTVSGQKPE